MWSCVVYYTKIAICIELCKPVSKAEERHLTLLKQSFNKNNLFGLIIVRYFSEVQIFFVEDIIYGMSILVRDVNSPSG